MAKTEKAFNDTALANVLAAVAIVAGVNYAAVQMGYPPVAYCWGKSILSEFQLEGWYNALVFGTAIISVLIGCIDGFARSIRWLVLLALLLSVPHWLEAGFRLGKMCRADTLALVKSGELLLGPPRPLPSFDAAPPVNPGEFSL